MMNVVWDFDGTILDTYPTIVKSFIEVSGQDLDEKEVLASLKVNSKDTFKKYGVSEELRPRFEELDHAYSFKEKPPFPFVEKALDATSKNVLVTHRNRASTIHLLTQWGIMDKFAEVVCVEDDGFPRKPDEAAYQYVASRHDIDLVIGDRALDLIPGRKLGWKTCAFQNEVVEADAHLDSYENFAGWLKQTFGA